MFLLRPPHGDQLPMLSLLVLLWPKSIGIDLSSFEREAVRAINKDPLLPAYIAKIIFINPNLLHSYYEANALSGI